MGYSCIHQVNSGALCRVLPTLGTVTALASKNQLGLFAPKSRQPVEAESAAEGEVPEQKEPPQRSRKPPSKEPSPEIVAALAKETGGVEFSSPSLRRRFAPRAPPAEPSLFPGEVAREAAGRRANMPFSRRMSDLIRRLQLLEREAKGDVGVTLPQAHAIHSLMDAGSLRMQELAADLGLAQSTVTRLVTPLKRMGLLDRRPDSNDGRATRAFLTEKGMVLVDALLRVDQELYDGLLNRLGETRRAEVVAAVELIHEAVLDLTME